MLARLSISTICTACWPTGYGSSTPMHGLAPIRSPTFTDIQGKDASLSFQEIFKGSHFHPTPPLWFLPVEQHPSGWLELLQTVHITDVAG